MKTYIINCKGRAVFLFCLFFGLILIFSACNKEDDSGLPEILKELSVTMTPSQIISSFSDRTETGTATITLMSDNSLDYSIIVNGLSATDVLTSAYIRAGSPVVKGENIVILADGVAKKFSNNKLEMTIDLSEDQANTINIQKTYLVINSTEKPDGLMRGQLGLEIVFACNAVLSPENQVPPIVGRNESGLALIRLTGSNTLYFFISVENLSPADKLLNSRISKGGCLENGQILCTLSQSSTDFGTSKTIQLNSNQVTCLLSDELYINVCTVNAPSGLLRGQIR